MAHGGDPPKKGSARWEALTNGTSTQYYLARRYFNYSVDEWDALPAWQSQVYIQGLKDQGVIRDANGSDEEGPAAGPSGTPATSQVDYASGWIPKGFKRRTT